VGKRTCERLLDLLNMVTMQLIGKSKSRFRMGVSNSYLGLCLIQVPTADKGKALEKPKEPEEKKSSFAAFTGKGYSLKG
jgi:hypothetical protein